MLEGYYKELKGDPREIRADLHMHSSASDGTWSPEELVRNVSNAGIRLFALTDHDTVGNVAQTVALAETAGLSFIPGVEIGATWNRRTYHILGLGVDVNNPALLELLRKNTERVDEKDGEAVEYLEGVYPQVSATEYLAYVNNRARGGWKALNYLIDKGLCKTYKDFFALFPGDAGDFVTFQYGSPSEVGSVIRQAGGCSVLAHPGASFYDPDYRTVLEHMKDEGIDGVECYHPENSDAIRQYIQEFCRANNLMITGGSDCHGDFVPKRRLGAPDIRLADLML